MYVPHGPLPRLIPVRTSQITRVLSHWNVMPHVQDMTPHAVQIIKPKALPRRVGFISVSASHAVGCGFMLWPGHTKSLPCFSLTVQPDCLKGQVVSWTVRGYGLKKFPEINRKCWVSINHQTQGWPLVVLSIFKWKASQQLFCDCIDWEALLVYLFVWS